jgi:sulfate-transporting ATPase
MPAEFIYTTYRLARHYPPDRTVLENISLSFYPGAKIGVIGPNGAGKSSLLRMAGFDDGSMGSYVGDDGDQISTFNSTPGMPSVER